NGLAGLCSSNTTREFTFSCGVSLTFRKYTLGLIADRETHIISLRNKVDVAGAEETLKSATNPAIREAIINGVKEAVKENQTQPAYATFNETTNFELSEYGKAYETWLLTKESGHTLGDIRVLLNSF